MAVPEYGLSFSRRQITPAHEMSTTSLETTKKFHHGITYLEGVDAICKGDVEQETQDNERNWWIGQYLLSGRAMFLRLSICFCRAMSLHLHLFCIIWRFIYIVLVLLERSTYTFQVGAERNWNWKTHSICLDNNHTCQRCNRWILFIHNKDDN